MIKTIKNGSYFWLRHNFLINFTKLMKSEDLNDSDDLMILQSINQ